MDANTVWHVWRRILRECALQKTLLSGNFNNMRMRFRLTNEEERIVRAYAKMPEQARWFIQNYRFRLINSFSNALETGAPLTLRLLLAKKIDLKKLGERFLNQIAWKDYGPYVYRYCHDILNFLSKQSITKKIEGLFDLIHLEKKAVELLRSLSNYVTHSDPAEPSDLLRQTPFARLYQTKTKISIWLRDKKQLGQCTIEKGSEYYLIYLTDTASSHKFIRLPKRAAELYSALDKPIFYSELSDQLKKRHCDPIDHEDAALINLLTEYKAIFPRMRNNLS